MDRLESLGNQISQITLYDIKSYYNQAKNMVLNVSEMEAKVREATNEDPWGASSTLMLEIAQGTFNFQQFNEIMPCIYSRFMEKEAKQWREIYKALQLLEYIIKNGSERVVDDARSHLSTIKMLRNFHYVDDNGRDHGLDVRRRATYIAALLSDLDEIRSERRKAKANRGKYVGTGNDGMSFGGSGGRYGGFGNDGLYGSAGGGYSGNTDYYNGGGGSSSSFRDDTNRKGYDEYDAGEYEETPASRRSNSLRSPTSPSTPRHPSGSGNSGQPPRIPEDKEKAKEKEKAVAVDDLLGDWGDDSALGASSTTSSIHDKALPALVSPGTNDGDDFDDFQSAPMSPPSAPLTFPQAPIQASVPGNAKANVFDILNQSPQPTAVAVAPALSGAPAQQTWQQTPALQAQPVRPNYFSGSMGTMSSNSTTPMSPATAPLASGASMGSGGGSLSPTPAAARPSASGSTPGASGKPRANFDDLWSLGLGASGKAASGSSSSNTATTAGKSIKDLEREKAQAGIWGASQGVKPQAASMGSSFGAFGSSTAGGSAVSGGGGDDLLL